MAHADGQTRGSEAASRLSEDDLLVFKLLLGVGVMLSGTFGIFALWFLLHFWLTLAVLASGG